MGKTYSKPLATGHGMGAAWARHAMRESAFIVFKQNNIINYSLKLVICFLEHFLYVCTPNFIQVRQYVLGYMNFGKIENDVFEGH